MDVSLPGATPEPPQTHPLPSPYKGLAAFEDSELDAIFFFGREREVEIIAANLMAYRLTVLYGATGVGKSSVLGAGVAHELRSRAGEAEAPEFAVVSFDSWSGDVVSGLEDAVRQELSRLFAAVPSAPRESLAETFAAWADELGCELYLILDQAEEYFLYHAARGGGRFGVEFGELVTRPGCA